MGLLLPEQSPPEMSHQHSEVGTSAFCRNKPSTTNDLSSHSLVVCLPVVFTRLNEPYESNPLLGAEPTGLNASAPVAMAPSPRDAFIKPRLLSWSDVQTLHPAPLVADPLMVLRSRQERSLAPTGVSAPRLTSHWTRT